MLSFAHCAQSLISGKSGSILSHQSTSPLAHRPSAFACTSRATAFGGSSRSASPVRQSHTDKSTAHHDRPTQPPQATSPSIANTLSPRKASDTAIIYGFDGPEIDLPGQHEKSSKNSPTVDSCATYVSSQEESPLRSLVYDNVASLLR
jgi:hypothetical protein